MTAATIRIVSAGAGAASALGAAIVALARADYLSALLGASVAFCAVALAFDE